MSGFGARLTGLLLCCALLAGPQRPASGALVLGEPRLLLDQPGRVERPAIRGGVENLFALDLSGGEPVALTAETRPEVQFAGVRWSPNGDFLVYTSNKGTSGSFDLWVISADGKHDEPLTTEPSLDWMPAWSPDGQHIAFVSDRQNGDALWLIGVDGSGLRKLAELAYEPALSPDGQLLAAHHIAGGNDGIYLFDLSGDRAPRLVLDQGRMPTWSDDGRYLIAVRNEPAGDRLWVADLQSDTTSALGPTLDGLSWPSWGAEGPQLAYERRLEGRKQIYVVPVIESRPVAVVQEPLSGTAVRGNVVVRATIGAEGSRVATWRLEAGSGVSPAGWSLVAEGTGNVDGELARWHTGGLEGLYTLRLTAVTDTGDTTVSAVTVTIFGQYGVRWEANDIPATMIAGRAYPVELRLTNTGTMTWRNDGQFPVEGNYQWVDENGRVVVPEGRASRFDAAVGAEEKAVLKGVVVAPPSPGNYTLRYDLRQAQQVWFGEQGAQPLEVPVTVVVEYGAGIDAPAVPSVMVPGQIYTVEVRLANLGASVWPGLDGAAAKPGTMSVTYLWRNADGGVVDLEPLATPLPGAVAAGGTAVLNARVQAPSVAGRYRLSIDLRDGQGLLRGRTGAILPGIDVVVSAPYAVEFGEHNTPGRMFPGDILRVNLQCRNTGSVKWRAESATPVTLGYQWLNREGKAVPGGDLSTSLPYDVLPGMTAAVTARVQTPGEPGEYTLVWDLMQPGGRRFEELGSQPLRVPVMVGSRTHSVTWQQIHHPVEMVVGSLYTVELRLTNNGAMTWQPEGPDGVRLGYHWVKPDGEELTRAPLFTPLEKPVNQGENVRVAARVQAPDRPGDYMLRWDLYQGGYDYFSQRGAATLDIPVKVQVIYGAQYVSHDTPVRLVAGTRYAVNLRLRNLGTVPWESHGTVPVVLSYRWYGATGEEVPQPKPTRTDLPRTVQPGASADVLAYLDAPQQPGRYDLEWDLLFAGAFWFSEKGVQPLRVSVVVE
ncbi:MAG: PD40 domain-containing protein [Armatimonadetes bacterium]|nr:PD40 domain-containing protein [Armatimonadota bacterium]